MGYWEHDAEYDYGRICPPHTHTISTLKLDPPKSQEATWNGVSYKVYLSERYQHRANRYWYHPTDHGMWVPVEGQGVELYPRGLDINNLIGYQPQNKIKVGDIVRLKTGSAPIVVEVVSGRYFTGHYTNSGTRVVGRLIEEIVLHEDYNKANTETETKGTDKMADNKTLYEITVNNDTVYGHYLATNSSGQ